MKRLDLIAVPLACWGLLALGSLAPSTPMQSVLALVAALFCPGYSLLAALYPKGDELDPVERLTLSVALSVALLPFLGMVLFFGPWHLTFASVASAIAIVSTALAGVATLRARRGHRSSSATKPGASPVGPKALGGRVASVVALAALAALLGVFIYRFQQTPQGAAFTEFYLVQGRSEAPYPTLLTTDIPADYTVAIVNRQRQTIRYRLRVMLEDQVREEIAPIPLENKQMKELKVPVTASQPVERARLQFLLFRDGEVAPLRIVQLWVRVQADRP